jgi:hypothetical protein
MSMPQREQKTPELKKLPPNLRFWPARMMEGLLLIASNTQP